MSETELKKLKTQSKRLKSQLTRFENFYNQIDLSNEHAIKELEVRLSGIENLLNSFNDIQCDIDVLQNNDDNFSDENSSFEDRFYKVVSAAKETISKAKATNAEINTRQYTTCTPISHADSILQQVNLPPIKLLSFGGEYDKWLQFKDTFTSLIDSNELLNNVQKFTYLKTHLEKEALATISSLQINAANYSIAWELLRNRFENKKLIINTHLKGIIEGPNTIKDNFSSLRQFIDNLQTNLRALEALGIPVNEWDTILIYLLANKLDLYTRKEWENIVGRKGPEELPSVKEFIIFLNNRCQTLEMMDKLNKLKPNETHLNQKPNLKRFEKPVSLPATVRPACNYCKNTEHRIYSCDQFLNLPISKRWKEISRLQLCQNCLRTGHKFKDCRLSNCKQCKRPHNGLLHQNDVKQEISENTTTSTVTAFTNFPTTKKPATILLSTALVEVTDYDNRRVPCRALLDSGSQTNFITKDLLTRLGLITKKVNVPISGINQTQSIINQQSRITICSRINNFRAQIDALVLEKITDDLPQHLLNCELLQIPSNIELADPDFYKKGKIDMLIGAELFYDLLSVGQIKLAKHLPLLQKTKLGWVVTGALNLPQLTKTKYNSFAGLVKIEEQLERFWKIEELEEKTLLYSEREILCEEHFLDNYTRNPEGRFKVGLPKTKDVELGNSKEIAMNRLEQLEKRLQSNKNLYYEYQKFIEEYKELGHMQLVEERELKGQQSICYLPHHPVLKRDSLTTKLRVVFDASAKTSNMVSLNDLLLVGPTIQEDLFNILIRFRSHQIGLTADITKMYRQIEVREEDTYLQLILWRDHPDAEISTYRLKTVTYGTSSAPFLATRCLKQLALEDGEEYPLAKKALETDFYVDDVLTGARTEKEAKELQRQLTQLLERGKFNLRKWRSNSQFLGNLQNTSEGEKLLILDKHEIFKTLGVKWNSYEDVFQYEVEIKSKQKVTKRTILSQIAQIFDPLGLLGPILTTAKVILQKLWQLKLGWDESVPQAIFTEWTSFAQQLTRLNEIKIGRNINPNNKSNQFDLHGYCDASEAAYGACIYAVSTNMTGDKIARLICSKARVAPLQKQTIPRLELNAALLLSKLMNIVKVSMQDKVLNCYCYSDSTIVLSWLKLAPTRLKTYVSNRVANIQKLTKDVSWRHVRSKENPADVLSRGISPDKLQFNDLWWYGPEYLKTDDYLPEFEEINMEDKEFNEEFKITIINLPVVERFSVLEKYSSFQKLTRIMAYCKRFIRKLQRKKDAKTLNEKLHLVELEGARKTIIAIVQRETFHQEIKELKKNKVISKTSRLLPLHPFIDDEGLLRVGGRLRNSELDYDAKHQYLLPKNHWITYLIFKQEHERLLHCGAEQLLAQVRQNYWPISGRSLARKVTKTCLKCFRTNPKIPNHIMGDLPKQRVIENIRPFSITGIDFAGPITIRESRKRGRIPTTKAYIAVFICFNTKAIHLELVSSLTTEAFMACLQRFFARRGVCREIFSDNATNFVGTNQKLKEVYRFVEKNKGRFDDELIKNKITWNFIPPRSPHFGGLWESAVKLVKRHFYKVTSNLILTFEECYTLLTSIESCLNSRPLTPLSSDPHDLQVLTPAHIS